jgi:hypothetical protein
MRMLIALPLLTLGACNVDNDTGNDTVRLEYNEQRIEEGAEAAARTARDVGSGIANVAATAGRAVKNEVGDIDVDVDVTRNRSDGNGTDGNRN